tara:strand:+ start:18968 stop:20512 length:1545 start_codon:yes stop_codon:yes gene_type:complete
MKILDCTFRDGGYYTNWDFNKSTLDTYIDSLNNLPVDYIEMGYRSKPKSDYHGEFFYSPVYVLKEIKKNSEKKIAIMLNEKDIASYDLDYLLKEIVGLVDMIRVAVDPDNLKRALALAIEIKAYGFEIGFNIMYMSIWKKKPDFLEKLSSLNDKIDYLYMVDSYGSIYPDEVIDIIKIVKTQTNVPLGFHGHNNIELGLINTLTAIENGVDIVDATITGMGRGAGNLKTELLLTVLNAKGVLDFDYNHLSNVVDVFANIQSQYLWGTNLPYMVSGANSSPQKQVMDLVTKRAYSFNSIIRTLQNQFKGLKDNQSKLPSFGNKFKSCKNVLIVGGGPSVVEHSFAIQKYLKQNPNIFVIHASSKNALAFKNIDNQQVFCLIGNEGFRMENIFIDGNIPENTCCVLPVYPRKMGTYIPVNLNEKTYELNQITFTDKFKDAHTAIALQTALEIDPALIEIVGYDGYLNKNIDNNQQELSIENQYLFKMFKEFSKQKLSSLTLSYYDELNSGSIFSKL